MSANRQCTRPRVDYLRIADEHGWWILAIGLVVLAILSRAGVL